MIPLGLEPKTYCLEGSCSIQLSYGTDLCGIACCRQCGCKGSDFFGNYKILSGKSYIGAVVEGVIALKEGLGSLEFTDVERV